MDNKYIFVRILFDKREHSVTVDQKEAVICIKAEIPKEICEIDDELKAIYHSQDTVCIWVFKSREDRNNFMNDTVGMNKEDREKYFSDNYG